MASNDEEIEFNAHKWVWIPDKTKTFVKGFILEDNLDNGAKLKIRTEDDKDIVLVKDETQPVNPPKFNCADDMAELTHLNEPSVLYNLQSRYMNDLIYTYSGLFLVAVNPYANVSIYGPDYVDMYNGSNKADTKPHIFAITELTYRYMLEKQQNQSILVTGESGAGKTENTKKIIQYLAAITTGSSRLESIDNQQTFEDQIIQANPILESFGNAQTVRNNNSSRFGKFIRIEFSGKGKISGANIDWYLLEKSRVINQSENERNYHIFYQLLLGLSQKEKENFFINHPANSFNYLKRGNITIPNVDDKKEYRDLIHAFEIMNFTKDESDEIFKTIAIILLIGNIEFVNSSSSDSKARFTDNSPLKNLCQLLGISLNEFKMAILNPKVKAGKEFVTQNKTAAQAKFSLDAISKSLYERTFKFIVDKINDKLDHSLSISNFIGVLDIAGFEIFKQNSFEQLCINYTNEKLQQFFNHHMFVLEQNEYIKENISWKFIDFGQDLQETIDLIESSQNPIGILSILNEECIVPKSTDKSFILKLNSVWDTQQQKSNKPSSKFKKSRYDNGFTVRHYAGEVDYTTDDWLDKNRDPLNSNVVDLLLKSSNNHIALLFADAEGLNESNSAKKTSPPTKGSLLRTVAQRHKEQLNDLMTQLSNTYPHFVRCILPNNKKKPHDLNKKLVLDQLRCNGVLEGIRIARAGYPNRIFFKEFYQRYKFLAKELQVFGSSNDFKKNCEIILKSIKLDSKVYKVGLTKIFFKNGILAHLELKRDEIIKDIFIEVQSMIRGFLTRMKINKELSKVQAAQVIAKNFKIFNELKANQWYNLMIKIKPLLDSTQQQKQKQLVIDQVNKFKEEIEKLELEKSNYLKENNELNLEIKKLNLVLTTERSLLKEKDTELESTKKKEIELSRSIQSNINESKALSLEITKIKAEKELNDKKINSVNEMVEAKNRKIEELENQKKLVVDEKSRLQRELNKIKSDLDLYKKDSSVQIELKIKNATTSLNLEVKKLNNENIDLKEQLVKLKANSTKLELSRSTKSRDLDTLNKTIESQQSEINQLTNDKKQLISEKSLIQKESEKAKEEKILIESKFKKLEADALEAKNLLKIKIADDIKFDRGKQKFDNEILELKHSKKLLEDQLREMEEENKKLVIDNNNNNYSKSIINKNNNNLLELSGDEKLVSEYNSMKLLLNEKSAELTHELQENKKLIQENKVLSTRLASESFDNQKLNAQLRKMKRGSRINYIQETSFNNDFLNGSSSNNSSDSETENNDLLKKEIESLKTQLKLERNSSQKSEELILDLQRQLKSNKSGSNNSQLVQKFNSFKNEEFRDIYKIKFENADARVKSLEKQLKDFKSSPLKENHNVQNTLSNNNNSDFQELIKKLRILKNENSRLKQMLNDDNNTGNRSFDGETSKEFIFQEELVTSRLRLQNSQSRIEDLSKQLELFKERSEEYFNKLESAEHVVRSSKKSEINAKKKVEELTTILNSLKNGEKSNENQLAKLQLKINQLETKNQSKETEIKRLKVTQQTLTEELEHYRFKLVTDSNDNNGKDKKFDELNRKLKEKLILETNLKKDLKISKMLLKEITSEKELNDLELNKFRKEKNEILDKLTKLEADNARFKSLDKNNSKKIDSLIQQINTLHDAMDKMINERELIQNDKEILEKKIEELMEGNDTNDAISIILDQQKKEIERNRKELEMNRKNQKYLKKELIDEKQKTLLVIEENKGLENLIKEIQNDLNENKKNNINSKDSEFYLRKISELEKELKEYEDNDKNFLIMERLIKDLKLRIERLEKENDELIEENEIFSKNSKNLKSLVNKLEENESLTNLNYKRIERQLKDQKEAKIRSEMDLLNWKNRIGGKLGRK